ncbi:hypothetical protein QBC34DRAFT_102927 [Podospora aff. communis PSN243]|uniref:Uncharacterized protein n=1 Tax=Podospora aff. communis PSN243 TaxID=3040156 RepID=A0AAV9GLJ7_9PEZI|nr:hypothetical protein QBC34DRAFT_102927 [Podospora aff. communis PSN243]
MATLQSPFLRLPREMRDQIYHEYLMLGTEGGYTYDFTANKLRTTDQKPIDLSLMYTCRLIAAEMHGLALRTHTITFTTLYSDELRARAGRWDFLMTLPLQPWVAKAIAGRMSPATVEEVTQRCDGFPFHSEFQLIRTGEAPGSYYWCWTFGDIPSVYRQVRREVLQHGIADPVAHSYLVSLHKPVHGGSTRRVSTCHPETFLAADKEPWRIPTHAELDALAEAMLRNADEEARARWENWGGAHAASTSTEVHDRSSKSFWDADPGKFRFSAAAAAIHFLSSTSANTRRQIRRVVLDEDRRAVASPECHIQGLVPFCLENPLMTVERRVNLWRNIFLPREHAVNRNFDILKWGAPFSPSKDRLPTRGLSKALAHWLCEAALVPTIPDTVTLLVDDSPNPELASEIFQEIVHRDAAWQTATDRYFALGDPAVEAWSALTKTASSSYQCRGFPELLSQLCCEHSHGKASRVTFNFEPGTPWDEDSVDQIIEEGKELAQGEIMYWGLGNMEPSGYDLGPSLPGFQDLVDEMLLVQGEPMFPQYVDIARGRIRD